MNEKRKANGDKCLWTSKNEQQHEQQVQVSNGNNNNNNRLSVSQADSDRERERERARESECVVAKRGSEGRESEQVQPVRQTEPSQASSDS